MIIKFIEGAVIGEEQQKVVGEEIWEGIKLKPEVLKVLFTGGGFVS